MKWLLGVSLVIAIAMGWAATAMVSVAAVSIDDVSLRFLPPDTDAIAFVDVASLKNAPLVQDLLKTQDLPLPNKLADFTRLTGFDPKQDIDRVTVAKVGAREALLVVQGRIDKFKVAQFLKDEGKVPEVYLGQSIYRDGDGAVVILDNVALIGQFSAVTKAIDQMQLPGSLPLRVELMSGIQQIEAGNQVWAVGNISLNDLGLGVARAAPVMEMLKNLRSGTFQLRVDSGIHARGTGTFTEADSAQQIGDMVRSLLAIVRLQVSAKDPTLLSLLDGIQVSYSGSVLTVKVDESAEAIEKLKSLKPAQILQQ